MNLNLLEFNSLQISKQLDIEQKILSSTNENWCIINSGSTKTIVMGLSTKSEDVLNSKIIKKDNVNVIRRFSGGGTVIVDGDTIFITFIFQKTAHKFESFPEQILKWTEQFYKSALKLPLFSLQDNDYTLGDKKIGGNAQYIKKNCWLHHSTFLHDFSDKNMEYLKLPKQQPNYRKNRPHADFLTTLKGHITKQSFIELVKNELSRRYLIKSLNEDQYPGTWRLD